MKVAPPTPDVSFSFPWGRRWPRWVFVVLALAVALGLRLTNANPAVAQSVVLAAWKVDEAPGFDPYATTWQRLPSVEIPLTAQQVTFPVGGGTVPMVHARGVHHDGVLYVSVEWVDVSKDETTGAIEDFADAVAVQFPAHPASSVPAVCMGQADQAVNIWHWRADSQRGVPPIPDEANAWVDLYPSTDDLFYPARDAGNPFAVGEGPVQNLVAGGFGTLTPVGEQVVAGSGVHRDGRWGVVFARPFPAPGEEQPTFAPGQEIDVAFAVWDGARDDRDGQKSVSAFTKMELRDEAFVSPPPIIPPDGVEPGGRGIPAAPFVGIGAAILALAALAGWAVRSSPSRSRD